jgi:hypothetical protein
MPPAPLTNPERIMAALRESASALSATELAAITGISPRNQVDVICNRLAKAGKTVRERGPGGILVNRLADESVAVSGRDASAALVGPSLEQRMAEPVILRVLGEQLGVELRPRRLVHSSSARVEIDGADDSLSILVECWAHQEPAKVAQKYKLVNDATRLGRLAGWLVPRPQRLLLCLTDEEAVRYLRGSSWQGQAIAALGVEIVVVELPEDLVVSIREAQIRQFR